MNINALLTVAELMAVAAIFVRVCCLAAKMDRTTWAPASIPSFCSISAPALACFLIDLWRAISQRARYALYALSMGLTLAGAVAFILNWSGAACLLLLGIAGQYVFDRRKQGGSNAAGA